MDQSKSGGSRKVGHGRGKPAHQRYTIEQRWLKNKERKIDKQAKLEAKKKLRKQKRLNKEEKSHGSISTI